MYKFKQVFDISAALVKEQVINQGKKYWWFFFLCDVTELYEDAPTPLNFPHGSSWKTKRPIHPLSMMELLNTPSMDFPLTFKARSRQKTKYFINYLNTMTKSNLTRNCTLFVSWFITYKLQPNIVKYSNVWLLIKWWQLYKTIKLVSIWDKNDFSRTFQEQQPRYDRVRIKFSKLYREKYL